MSDTVKKYIKFISENKSERECVQTFIKEAEKKGYSPIEDHEIRSPGDRVYLTVYGKAIALFEIGTEPLEEGLNILCAHIDSPRLDLKMKPLYEKNGIVYLNTHYYGGIKKYQWVTLPLAIHGVVAKKNGEVVNGVLGEDDDDYSFAISDIVPHHLPLQFILTRQRTEYYDHIIFPGFFLYFSQTRRQPVPYIYFIII